MFKTPEQRPFGEMPPRSEVYDNSQELTPLDLKILDVSELIKKLEKDLSNESDAVKKKAIENAISREKENKQKLLDEKFTVAKPKERTEGGLNDFDRALMGTGEYQEADRLDARKRASI